MLGIALALGASLSWGVADFLGGLQTRRVSVYRVLVISQPIGLLCAWGLVVTLADRTLAPGEFAIAALGGVAVIGALGAFYSAMALGSISVVAMIAALGVLVPIIGGVVQGETPPLLQWCGGGVAFVGVMLVVSSHGRVDRAGQIGMPRRSVGLAALAALGFGLFLLAVDGAADTDAAWAIAAARSGSMAGLLVAIVALRPTLRGPGGRALAPLLAIGVLEVSANALYAFATNHGLLPLVAIAGSLYSVVVVLLAAAFTSERLSRPQVFGVALALTGVATIAAGS